MKNAIRTITSLTLLACIALTVFAMPAIAASKYQIAGTCRSDAQWYVSAIDRRVASEGTTIRASFYNLCCRDVYFRLINANTGSQFGSTIVASGDTQTLATSVKAGTLFNNAFRLSSSCNPLQDRKFAGYEWY